MHLAVSEELCNHTCSGFCMQVCALALVALVQSVMVIMGKILQTISTLAGTLTAGPWMHLCLPDANATIFMMGKRRQISFCKVCSLDSAALMLALYYLSLCCLCKVCLLDSDTVTLALYFLSFWVCSLDSAALLHAFCSLSLTIMLNLTLSDKATHNCFIALPSKVCSSCLLGQNSCWQLLHLSEQQHHIVDRPCLET